MGLRKGKDTKKATPVTVVDGVREQTDQAAAIASIAGQERLADPRLNPATRPHVERRRDDQQIKTVDAEHARTLRRLRVADSRAAEAEETLQAIALARRAQSPARSVRELHVSRRRYTRGSLAASVVLAAGSAMGLEEAAELLPSTPAGSGYIAELGLTVLATVAIGYRAHLAEHRGRLAEGSWQARALLGLMTVPLAVSVLTNLAMVNVIGAVCALGAAAFSLLSVVVADRSAAAMQARADEVSETAEEELLATAMGENVFSAVTADDADPVEVDPVGSSVAAAAVEAPATKSLPAAEDEHGDEGQDVAGAPAETTVAPSVAPSVEDADGLGDELAGEIEAWLSGGGDPPEAGASASGPTLPGGGPAGAARGLPGRRGRTAGGHDDDVAAREGRVRTGDDAAAERGHIDSDEDDGSGRDGVAAAGSDRGGVPDEPGASRVQSAVEARLAAGESTRAQIAAYKADHPKATQKQIAAALDISVATVKRHQRRLRQDGGR